MGVPARVGRALGVVCGAVLAAHSSLAMAVEVEAPGVAPVATTIPGVAGPSLASKSAAAAGAGDDSLVGVFAIDAGTCTGSGDVGGSTFRMIQPGGTADGPFLSNGDSPCEDQTYTPVSPGDEGGLSTAGFQPNPVEAFDGSGNGAASAITKPQRFLGVAFAVSTNDTDPQTGTIVPAPAISASGGTLSGDLRAVSVAYNRQHFNQGSPKPDGSHPGLTAGPAGTYDASTRAFTLDWMSTIVGGPFNNFTGSWHLEGTFRPSAAPTPPPTPSADAPVVTAAAEGSTSPVTGGSVPVPLALALVVAGSAGLVLRRRAASAKPGAVAATAATAGGRARRP